jgi:hypothetical protein
MRRTLAPCLAALLVPVLVLVGCSSSDDAGSTEDPTTTEAPSSASDDDGGDEGSETSEPIDDEVAALTAEDYEGALVEQFTGGGGSNLVLAPEAASCLAPRWVEAMTVERLQQAGTTVADLADPSFDVTVLELPQDAAEAMAASFGECDVNLIDEFAVQLAGEAPDVQDCIVDTIDEDEFYRLVALGFAGEDTDTGFEELYDGLVQECELPPN